MLIRLNRRFKALFEKFITSSKAATSYTSYSGYSGSGSYHNIYFYEWGDMTRSAKRFETINGFIEFLNECNLTITEEQKDLLEKNSWCYATCAPHRNILMVSEKYLELKDKFDNLKKTPYLCTSLARYND